MSVTVCIGYVPTESVIRRAATSSRRWSGGPLVVSRTPRSRPTRVLDKIGCWRQLLIGQERGKKRRSAGTVDHWRECREPDNEEHGAGRKEGKHGEGMRCFTPTS